MNAPMAAPRSKGRTQYVDRGSTMAFALAVIAVLIYGWQHRDEYYLSAEHGIGYALGIIGGGMMLALLLYPLRKRLSFMARWLPLRHWFRAHMVLGVLGPLCILYHCNFSLGAANSNIALLCMGLMVGSGLVGRYIYGKIHYGRRANIPFYERLFSLWHVLHIPIFFMLVITSLIHVYAVHLY